MKRICSYLITELDREELKGEKWKRVAIINYELKLFKRISRLSILEKQLVSSYARYIEDRKEERNKK